MYNYKTSFSSARFSCSEKKEYMRFRINIRFAFTYDTINICIYSNFYNVIFKFIMQQMMFKGILYHPSIRSKRVCASFCYRQLIHCCNRFVIINSIWPVKHSHPIFPLIWCNCICLVGIALRGLYPLEKSSRSDGHGGAIML